jgi:hypothetical protein
MPNKNQVDLTGIDSSLLDLNTFKQSDTPKVDLSGLNLDELEILYLHLKHLELKKVLRLFNPC